MITQINTVRHNPQATKPSFGMAYRPVALTSHLPEYEFYEFDDPNHMNLKDRIILGLRKAGAKLLGQPGLNAEPGESGYAIKNKAMFFSNDSDEQTYTAFFLNYLNNAYPQANVLEQNINFSDFDVLNKLEKKLYKSNKPNPSALYVTLDGIYKNPSYLNRLARALASEGKNIDLSRHTFYD